MIIILNSKNLLARQKSKNLLSFLALKFSHLKPYKSHFFIKIKETKQKKFKYTSNLIKIMRDYADSYHQANAMPIAEKYFI